MNTFTYPVELSEQPEGGYLVTFPNIIYPIAAFVNITYNLCSCGVVLLHIQFTEMTGVL